MSRLRKRSWKVKILGVVFTLNGIKGNLQNALYNVFFLNHFKKGLKSI